MNLDEIELTIHAEMKSLVTTLDGIQLESAKHLTRANLDYLFC